jgi:hypothetical protein
MGYGGRYARWATAAVRLVPVAAGLHVPGVAVDWEFYPLLQRCEEVRVAAADLRWLDWERWSQRQNAAMKLGGIVGTLTLEGNLAPFTSLLRAAEVLHAGKGATFCQRSPKIPPPRSPKNPPLLG